MTTNSTNLNLVLYNTMTDGSALMYKFIDDVSGSLNSNMTKIDAWGGVITGSITALQSLETKVNGIMSASPVVLSLNPNVTNEWLLSGGSAISITTTASASTVAVNVCPASGSDIRLGTSASQVVTPKGLAESLMGTKTICKFASGTVTTGSGYMYIPIPEWAYNTTYPWDVVDVETTVDTAGSSTSGSVSGSRTIIQLISNSNNLLSTAMYIDAEEYTSKDGTIQAVIDPTYKSLNNIKRIRVDVIDECGQEAVGLTTMISIRRP